MGASRNLVLGVTLAGALAACGGGSSSGGGSSNGAPAAGGGLQHPAHLVGDVGHNDAFVITVTDGQGHAIKNLAAGTYQLVVHDESSIHDFHLTGSGVDVATTVPEKTTKTFTVTFKPGTYMFQCDTHPTQMNGTFRVS